MKGRDAARTSYDPSVSGPRGEVRTRWVHEGSKAKLSGQDVVVGDEAVYATTKEDVYAVDPASGDVDWSASLGHGLRCPLVYDGDLYLGAGGDDHVFSLSTGGLLSRLTGRTNWRLDAPDGWAKLSPAPFDGNVLAGSMGVLYELTPAGDVERTHTFGEYMSSPAVDAGVLYIGLRGFEDLESRDDVPGSVVAVDARSGAERWRFRLDHRYDKLDYTPAVAGDTVYAVASRTQADDDGYLFALDRRRGDERWRFSTDGRLLSPAVTEDLVVVGGLDGVFAVDRATGERRWHYRTDGWATQAVVTRDSVYVGGDGVTAIDLASGQRLWHHPTPHRVGVPAVDDGVVFAGGLYGTLHAIEGAR